MLKRHRLLILNILVWSLVIFYFWWQEKLGITYTALDRIKDLFVEFTDDFTDTLLNYPVFSLISLLLFFGVSYLLVKTIIIIKKRLDN